MSSCGFLKAGISKKRPDMAAGFTQSAQLVSFIVAWETTEARQGVKSSTNVYARRKCSAEYKRGREQRRVKGKRSKCICFNYVERGQLLWWQIIKDAMRAHVIKNPYIYEHSWILIVEIQNTLKGFIALFYLDVFPLPPFRYYDTMKSCDSVTRRWTNSFDLTWYVGHTSSLESCWKKSVWKWCFFFRIITCDCCILGYIKTLYVWPYCLLM